jgi:hypothetical protein
MIDRLLFAFFSQNPQIKAMNITDGNRKKSCVDQSLCQTISETVNFQYDFHIHKWQSGKKHKTIHLIFYGLSFLTPSSHQNIYWFIAAWRTKFAIDPATELPNPPFSTITTKASGNNIVC